MAHDLGDVQGVVEDDRFSELDVASVGGSGMSCVSSVRENGGMDAGGVALVGAVAAVLGAALGAGGAVSAAAIGARKQARAQHEQWRRQGRHDAFVRFGEAANSTVHLLMRSFNSHLAGSGGIDPGSRPAAFAALQAARSSLGLAGPQDMVRAADTLYGSISKLGDLVSQMSHLGWPDTQKLTRFLEELERVHQARDEFEALGRVELDGDSGAVRTA
jgi:hypothetical protein